MTYVITWPHSKMKSNTCCPPDACRKEIDSQVDHVIPLTSDNYSMQITTAQHLLIHENNRRQEQNISKGLGQPLSFLPRRVLSLSSSVHLFVCPSGCNTLTLYFNQGHSNLGQLWPFIGSMIYMFRFM